MEKDDYARQRRTMVEDHIAARGVREPAVLAAMGEVARERFLPANIREFAYSDAPLPIAEGQTISQPYIVALIEGAAGQAPIPDQVQGYASTS